MEEQFNFQLKHKKNKRIFYYFYVYYQNYCNRTRGIRYARKLSKTFNSEVRLTEGKEPLKTSGTYIYEQTEPLKIRNYGKLV